MLAKEESGEIFPHRVSAATFVRMGLEIEEQQYILNLLLL
jgi:hypothetical protein